MMHIVESPAQRRPPSAGLAFVVSLIGLFSCVLGVVLGPVGVVLGIRAMREETHPWLVYGAILIGIGATIAGVAWLFADWDGLND